MQSRIPQLGYYHGGLGTFVYHDRAGPQMGDFLTDLTNSLSKGVQSIESQVTSLPQQLLNTGQGAATSAFLSTPAGQQAEQQGIQAGIQSYIAKAQAAAKANPKTTAVVLLGGAFLLFAILKPAARKARDTVVQYIPMPSFAPAAPAPAAAAAAPAKSNPRRRRRKYRHARRSRK